jgi:hypothetical protein
MFEQLDFVYEPSRGVAADVEYYRGALGAEFVFAVERFGTRVAMVRLTSDAPGLLLAEHLEGAARPAALDSGLRRTTQDLGPVVSPSGHRRTAGAAGGAPIIARKDAAAASPSVSMGAIMLPRLGHPCVQPAAA